MMSAKARPHTRDERWIGAKKGRGFRAWSSGIRLAERADFLMLMEETRALAFGGAQARWRQGVVWMCMRVSKASERASEEKITIKRPLFLSRGDSVGVNDLRRMKK